MLGFRYTPGDTIIEVLFSITIFSMIAIGGLTIMNQGMNTAQRSLEITLVKQQIDSQAEALRYIHQSYIAAYDGRTINTTSAATIASTNYSGAAGQWYYVSQAQAVSAAVPYNTITSGNQCRPLDNTTAGVQNRCVVNPKTAVAYTGTFVSGSNAPTYAQVRYDAANPSLINKVDGLWVQAEYHPRDAPTNTPGYYDFHIRACWIALGESTPAVLGTIVRLYEPK